MAARDEQRQEGKLWTSCGQKRRKQVTFQVVDAYGGHTQGDRKPMRERSAD
jgi:hypothetical protein